jgi:hypothetical protein
VAFDGGNCAHVVELAGVAGAFVHF